MRCRSQAKLKLNELILLQLEFSSFEPNNKQSPSKLNSNSSLLIQFQFVANQDRKVQAFPKSRWGKNFPLEIPQRKDEIN